MKLLQLLTNKDKQTKIFITIVMNYAILAIHGFNILGPPHKNRPGYFDLSQALSIPVHALLVYS